MQYKCSFGVIENVELTPFIPFSFVVHGQLVEYKRPVVMGILNVTADSFYDGGRHQEPEAMLAHARWLLEEGADIVDVGVASSRPGALLPPPEEEAARLAEAVSLLRRELPGAVLSVDTCRAVAARAAVEAGADMVNDIGGGSLDEAMFRTVADLQVPYVLMHGADAHAFAHADADSVPMPAETDGAEAKECVDGVVKFFARQLDRLYTLGVKDVWLDPGFGFGKSLRENHLLLRRLDELTTLFREPLLVGLSRKSMVYKPLGISPDEALDGTVALDAMALERGARILRVHDPRPARQTIRLLAVGSDPELSLHELHTPQPVHSNP